MSEPELVLVKEGLFMMGSTKAEVAQIQADFPQFEIRLLEREIPAHEVFLEAYKISKYPITNTDFDQFIQETQYVTTAEQEGTGFVFNPNHRVVAGANWQHPLGTNSDLIDKEKHPVVQVSWWDVWQFCRWLTTKTGQKYRLPTEAEWEKAARGTNGRRFPWGDQWEPRFCNAEYRFRGTTPIDYFEANNISPYGCVDMCGNVFEWTSTTIGTTEPWPAKYAYPYKPDDGRENLQTETRRVGRGGSYSRDWVYCRNTFRFADLPKDRYSAQGFRVVCEIQRIGTERLHKRETRSDSIAFHTGNFRREKAI